MSGKRVNPFPKIIAFVFLLAMSVIWVIPLVWGIVTSFKSEIELQSVGFKFLPIEWVLSNYTSLLVDNASTPLVRWFTNSLFISVTHTLLVLLVVTLSAFAFSRLSFRGKNGLFAFLMATMMFPAVVNLIPLYKISDI